MIFVDFFDFLNEDEENNQQVVPNFDEHDNIQIEENDQVIEEKNQRNLGQN